MKRAAFIGLLLLVGKEAHTGTYGSITRDHIGFRASVDTSVGSMSDHRKEGELYRENQRAAQKTLDQNSSWLEQMYRHYASGAHPYRRLLSHLSPSFTSDERTVSFEVRPPGDEMSFQIGRPMKMRLS